MDITADKKTRHTKRFSCSVCRKVVDRSFIPGEITFFSNCMLTDGCNGVLSVNPNVPVTDRSEITWAKKAKIVKKKFYDTESVVVRHQFPVEGAVIIELYINAVDNGKLVSVRADQLITSIQRRDGEVVLMLDDRHTGEVVVVNNQPFSPATVTESEVISLLDQSGSVLMLAVRDNMQVSEIDIEIAEMGAANGVVGTYGLIAATAAESMLATNHLRGVHGVVIDQLGYNVYAVVIPEQLKENSRTIRFPGLQDGVAIVYTSGAKASRADVDVDHIVFCHKVKFSDIITSGGQWLVINKKIVDTTAGSMIIR